jgi:signal peptidase I
MGHKFFQSLWELFYNILIIIAIVSTVRVFLITPFNVSGSSMVPTLKNNDYIIIDKLSYQIKEPQFEDIIVFTPPSPRMRQVSGIPCFITHISTFNFSKDACYLADFFIKRVIGLPGDTIEIRNGEVLRNDLLLDEKYLNAFNKHQTFSNINIFTVPDDRYFVLGDNRNGSSDSRAQSKEWSDPESHKSMPYVDIHNIEGRLWLTVFSPIKIKQKLQSFKD